VRKLVNVQFLALANLPTGGMMKRKMIILFACFSIILGACESDADSSEADRLPQVEAITSDSGSPENFEFNLNNSVSASVEADSILIQYGEFPTIEENNACISALIGIFGPFDMDLLEFYLSYVIIEYLPGPSGPSGNTSTGPHTGDPYYAYVLSICNKQLISIYENPQIEGVINNTNGDGAYFYSFEDDFLNIETDELTISMQNDSISFQPIDGRVFLPDLLDCLASKDQEFINDRGSLLSSCIASIPGAEILAPFLNNEFVVFEPNDEDIFYDGASGVLTTVAVSAGNSPSPNDNRNGDFVSCGMSADPDSIGISILRPAEFLHSLANLGKGDVQDKLPKSSLGWPCRMLFTTTSDAAEYLNTVAAAYPTQADFTEDYVNSLAALRVLACIESTYGADGATLLVTDNVDPDEWAALAENCPDLALLDYGQPQAFVQVSGRALDASDSPLYSLLPEIEWLVFVMVNQDLLPVFLVDANGNVNSIEGVSTSTIGIYAADHLINGEISALGSGVLLPITDDEDRRQTLEEVTHLINPDDFADALEEVTHLFSDNTTTIELQAFSDLFLDGIIIQDMGHDGIILQDPGNDGIIIQDPDNGIIIEESRFDGIEIRILQDGGWFARIQKSWIVIQDPDPNPIIIEDPENGITLILLDNGDLLVLDDGNGIIIQDPEGGGIKINNEGDGWTITLDPDADGIEIAHEWLESVSFENYAATQMEGDPDRPLECSADSNSKDDPECFCQFFPDDDVCLDGKTEK
jgi:hypothetical protein